MMLDIGHITKEMVMMTDDVTTEVKESIASEEDYPSYTKPWHSDDWPDKIKLDDIDYATDAEITEIITDVFAS